MLPQPCPQQRNNCYICHWKKGGERCQMLPTVFPQAILQAWPSFCCAPQRLQTWSPPAVSHAPILDEATVRPRRLFAIPKAHSCDIKRFACYRISKGMHAHCRVFRLSSTSSCTHYTFDRGERLLSEAQLTTIRFLFPRSILPGFDLLKKINHVYHRIKH